MNRRGFLKRLGLGAAAVVASPLITPAEKVLALPSTPLYVPSQRLDFGVPTQRLIMSTDIEAAKRVVRPPLADAPADGSIPMLLVHDEFRPPGWQQFGSPRVPAGTTLLVDRATAERWIERGVGTAGTAAPPGLQEASVKRWSARHRSEMESPVWDSDEPIFPPVGTSPKPRGSLAERDKHWGRMIEQASARLERAAPSPNMAWWDEPPLVDDGDWSEWEF